METFCSILSKNKSEHHLKLNNNFESTMPRGKINTPQ